MGTASLARTISGAFMYLVFGCAAASAQWIQLGADIDGEAAGDNVRGVSISADGSILAVGAPANFGANGQASGHVRVFAWDADAGTWVQVGADIDGEATDDNSGEAVSLSSDGTRVAIGAWSNDGGGTDSGHARVFEWSAGSGEWLQLGADLNGEAAGDLFGISLALSSDGMRLVVGALDNDGGGTDAGHARVFEWIPTAFNWVQLGTDIDGEAAGDKSGEAVSISGDGSRIAVGAHSNDDNGTSSGHVRVFQWHSATTSWIQLGSDIDGEAAGDYSGFKVSLSEDGSRVAIGAIFNNGAAGSDSGHVRIFEWIDAAGNWVQLGPDIDGEAPNDAFGRSVFLSADGSRVAAGAPWNGGAGGTSGHVRVHEWSSASGAWVQIGSDIDGEDAGDQFGTDVALSDDGRILAATAFNNDGNGYESGHARIFSWGLFYDDFESGGTGQWSAAVQ